MLLAISGIEAATPANFLRRPLERSSHEIQAYRKVSNQGFRGHGGFARQHATRGAEGEAPEEVRSQSLDSGEHLRSPQSYATGKKPGPARQHERRTSETEALCHRHTIRRNLRRFSGRSEQGRYMGQERRPDCYLFEHSNAPRAGKKNDREY